ncbi:lysylphosphatidylglycerol synthase domain-containing protein [Caldimonas brevitalea]|uniref:Membrane protein n=1 Tax=Caldimonas brevitalea TaxID=413882 RepID=A0A0G3BLC7_9BURK|nr:lysylphosphatidylglycerol synthase domain-containing protein [Caldimonas brevitalea]AKJ28196.1 membrane protein [Caldimonas brevitalea]
MNTLHSKAFQAHHRPPSRDEGRDQPDRRQPTEDGRKAGRWALVRKLLTWAFFALVAGLLVSHARSVDWSQVWETLKAYPATTLALAAALAGGSYLLYSTFDLIGRASTGHRLRTPTVLSVAFISYAFNLNLGALVGGVGFRYRLYSRLGLDKATITQVLGFSVLTNWLGYFALAGGVFTLGQVEVPAQWKIGPQGLQLLGLTLLGLVLAYLAACAWSPRRDWSVRGHELRLPSLRTALLQVVLSSVNWLTISCIVYVLLQQKVAYGLVVAVLMMGAVAGVLTHIPAGLGVLEAVFIALLGGQVPQGQLLGGLLAYRAVYYLAPLAVAALLYARIEAQAKKGAAAPAARPGAG